MPHHTACPACPFGALLDALRHGCVAFPADAMMPPHKTGDSMSNPRRWQRDSEKTVRRGQSAAGQLQPPTMDKATEHPYAPAPPRLVASARRTSSCVVLK